MRSLPTLIAVALATVALAAAPALAVQPDEVLPDPKLEARARELSAGLRCLVCQNQSIDDSEAPLAPGMTVSVEIKTDSRRVIDYLLSPLAKVGSEALKER